MTTEELWVQGMHCASCALNIDETLADLDGVVSAVTDLEAQRTKVEFDPSAIDVEAIAKAIEDLGYSARPV